MKTGKSLSDLATEITRQNAVKQDLIVPEASLVMSMVEDWNASAAADPTVLANRSGEVRHPLTGYAHNQLASHIKIPTRYYQRMLTESPSLLAQNVNNWLPKQSGNRMLRTMDGNIRAFLSDKYFPIDNYDLLEVVLPIIQRMGGTVLSCEVTDSHLYVKVVTDKLTGELALGDHVRGGFVFSNSEIGMGKANFDPFIERLVCTNGMIVADHMLGTSRRHIGRRIDDADIFYSDSTRKLDIRAFISKVGDMAEAVLDRGNFDKIVEQFKATKEVHAISDGESVADVGAIVTNVTKKFSLTEGEEKGVLAHLVQGGDLSGFGLVNAVTRMAEDTGSYDRATEVERFGGMMTGWSVADWKTVGMTREVV